MSSEAAWSWVVEGRVQGVGFRWFVLSTAERLGLGGWARNRPDGSVEVVARGTPEALSGLDQALRRGPPGAFVQHITCGNVPHQDVDANSFNIKR